MFTPFSSPAPSPLASVQPDRHHSSGRHPQLTSCCLRKIDDPTIGERAAVVHTNVHLFEILHVEHGQAGSEAERPVRGSELLPIEDLAAGGSMTLQLTAVKRGQPLSHQWTQVCRLARPGPCTAVASGSAAERDRRQEQAEMSSVQRGA